MNQPSLLLALVSVALYVAATWLFGRRLVTSQGQGDEVRARLPGLTVAAIALHGALLYTVIVTEDGLNIGLFSAASLFAWVAALLLLVGTLRRPLDNLGLLVLPLAALLIVPSILWPESRPVAAKLGMGTQVHVVVSVLAYAVLTIAACQSLILAYQEHRLSRKRPRGVLNILPPMMIQEELLFQLIALGFFLLTLSLATGMAFVADMFAQHLVHKTVLSLAAWLIFGTLLWGRWRHGWRGRTAVRLSLAGFVILALAYFGSKLVLELVLDRHWFSG